MIYKARLGSIQSRLIKINYLEFIGDKMGKRNNIFSFFFTAPAFVLYFTFVIVPVLFSVFYSVTEWGGVTAPVFNGIQNYIKLFSNEDYWIVVKNTVILTVLTVAFQVPLGLIFGYLLFGIVKGFKFFRTVYFMPVVVAQMAIAIMFSLFYNSDLGPLNKMLGEIGLQSLQHNWLSDPKVVLYSVIFPQVWQYIGLFIIMVLAGLRSIPTELFESAEIDGASSFKVFYSMAIPLIWEVIMICIILAVTGSLKSFDYSWAITRGGPGTASSYIAVMMYKEAFLGSNFGYASAITMTIMTYALVFTVLFKKIATKETIQF